MYRLIHIKEGLRIFRRSLSVKSSGVKRYSGVAVSICESIVKDCWNGRYFQTSVGHFTDFYMRDFGWCAESLIKLGNRDKVRTSLAYALGIYERHGRITTAISPEGIPFDFPSISPDSLAFLVRSLRLSGTHDHISRHRAFLNKEIQRYCDHVMDYEGGLVKRQNFSSIKDYARRYSSTYNNVMMAMLSNELKQIRKLDNPLNHINFQKVIKENLWQGSYFYDDLVKRPYVCGDANIFPYWTGVFDSKSMLKSSIESIREAGLDRPFPLKYSQTGLKEHPMIAQEMFAKDYERDCVWAHMGPIYISLVKKVDPSSYRQYVDQYRKVIEKNRNFLEVFTCDGRPYQSPFYYTDEGMLWASMYLDLL